MVHRGHIGTIFQAFSGSYLGRSTARTLQLLPDGCVLNERAIQKIRSGEQGWQYAAGALERFGADGVTYENRLVWLHKWLPRLTRRIHHPGNHRYAWPLTVAARKLMPVGLPYPKLQPLFSPTAAAALGPMQSEQ